MSERLRQEIEEILSRYEKFPLKEPPWRRLRRSISQRGRRMGQWLVSHLPRITVGRVMLVGVVLILVALFAPSLLNFEAESITRLVIIAGLVLFGVAFAFSLRRRYPHVEARWRGRPVELDEPGVSSRLRSWWGRWRSRRRSPR